jgi:hypothetical protein
MSLLITVKCAVPQLRDTSLWPIFFDAERELLLIGNGTDGAGFNPATMEAFSSQRDGTLTVVKENSPTSFVVEQTVKTMTGAKTMTIDTKTNQILLIAAEYAPPATPPPGGRAGRGTMIPDSFSIIVVGK